jgi:hypothetical protein
VAAYFARQAFMVGSDGAAHVSKPARVPPGDAWAGTGDGLPASTGPVGFGVGLGVGLGVDFGVDLEPDGACWVA